MAAHADAAQGNDHWALNWKAPPGWAFPFSPLKKPG